MSYLRKLLVGLALCVVSFLAGGLFVSRQHRVGAELVIYHPPPQGADAASNGNTQAQNSQPVSAESALKIAFRSTDGSGRPASTQGEKENRRTNGQEMKSLKPGEKLEVEVRVIPLQDRSAHPPVVTTGRAAPLTKIQWGTAETNPYPFNVLNFLVDQLLIN
ncbi:hypothetical protein ACFSC6_13735 [Rufibacter sediminis]|uniref:Uncharacterized protein n=1 Tax=Rufibacter sediminis TaxID=2762756 RepID=A0ABR6VYM4_9BACT|nr:hypothetical protein [Rufibacter sediminis]MBC3542255.1 hypothetical protein [Rufibacter sediminis]